MTREAEIRAKHGRDDAEAIVRDIRMVMSTPEGRRVYEWLRSLSGVFDAAPATEPERTAWIGHRALGLAIVQAFRDAAPEPCHQAEMDRLAVIEARRDEIEQAMRADKAATEFSIDKFLSPNNPETSNQKD